MPLASKLPVSIFKTRGDVGKDQFLTITPVLTFQMKTFQLAVPVAASPLFKIAVE